MRYVSPLILTILKNYSLAKIVNEYSNPPAWSERQATMTSLNICFTFLIVFSILQSFTFYFPLLPCVAYNTNARKNRVFDCKPGKTCRKLLVNRVVFEEVDELLGICSDTAYLVGIILYIHLALKVNCFQASSSKLSLMDEFVTKGQKLVVIPSLILTWKFILALIDVLKQNPDSQVLRTAQCLRNWWFTMDLFKSVLFPVSFCVVLLEFMLWSHGFCLLEALSHDCPHVSFAIQVTSHIRYALNSTVRFPDPAVGTHTRSKVVDITYVTTLHNESFVPNATICAANSNSISDDVQTNLNHCDFESYSVKTDTFKVSGTKHLSTSRGINFGWPCNVTSKFRKIRKDVDCSYRIKVQLNEESNFVYNYDYVYKLPESAMGYANANEWNKRSEYSTFHTIFNSDGEEDGFKEFQSLFQNIDGTLADHPLDTTHINLLAHEPEILYITCNRTCFCYDCIAGDHHVSMPKKCGLICPNRPLFDYRNFTRNDFCKSNHLDGCRNTWVPVSTVAQDSIVKYSELMTAQSPPNVTVQFAGKQLIAEFDPKILLPIPGKVPTKNH